MAFAKVLCSTARPASADDALAVLEPFAVKVAWAVLWVLWGGAAAMSSPYPLDNRGQRATQAAPRGIFVRENSGALYRRLPQGAQRSEMSHAARIACDNGLHARPTMAVRVLPGLEGEV